MPPTLAHVDGFEFQLLSTVTFAAGGTAMNGAVTNAVTEADGIRSGSQSLKCSPTGAAAGQVSRSIAAGHRTLVASFRVKIPTSLPASNLTLANTSGPTQTQRFGFNAATGRFRISYSSGGASTDIGPVVVADQVYLVDWEIDVSGTTFTQTARIDGDAGTEGTATRTSSTAADLTSMRLGSDSTSGPAATMYYGDWVFGYTLSEYPYGPHHVGVLKPTGDGTHNAGTNIVEDNAGADIGAVTAFNLIDEVPPENTDYIKQTAAGSGNYAEVTFANPAAADTDIWGVTAWCAIEGAAANASDLLMRIVDTSNNTLLDQGGAGAVSGTTRRYSAALVPPPGGAAAWSAEPSGDLSGLKGRVGFATDVSPVPRALTFVLQYAARDIGVPGGFVIVAGL